MENVKQKVELQINCRRVTTSQYEASCAGISGWGKTPAAAMSACVAAICKVEELQGFFWRDAETGLSGQILKPRKKPRAIKSTDKGAVFDLLGGKMNGDRRMKDDAPHLQGFAT